MLDVRSSFVREFDQGLFFLSMKPTSWRYEHIIITS